jgi:hypothetical protein
MMVTDSDRSIDLSLFSAPRRDAKSTIETNSLFIPQKEVRAFTKTNRLTENSNLGKVSRSISRLERRISLFSGRIESSQSYAAAGRDLAGRFNRGSQPHAAVSSGT